MHFGHFVVHFCGKLLIGNHHWEQMSSGMYLLSMAKMSITENLNWAFWVLSKKKTGLSG